jgi:hypothetical protein
MQLYLDQIKDAVSMSSNPEKPTLLYQGRI